MLMQLSGITKYFGATEILTNITFEVRKDERIAVVGRNGSGKSTLLQIMAGLLSYDQGEIFKRKDLTIGYLPQHANIQSEQTIWEKMLTVFQPLIEQEKKIRMLEEKMQNTSAENHPVQKELLKEYDALQQTFEQSGGYHYETAIKTVLNGLDFHEEDLDTPIHQLSGGQKTRLSLGKLLLQKPDLLLLDEPTNHLDIQTMTWLEDYLNHYSGAIVVVSHDRYFLDKLVDITYEIENHSAKKYIGSYSQFLQQKEKSDEKQLKQYEQQQAEIQKMKDFIQRNIAHASTSRRARSRRKQLEKMERLDKPLMKDQKVSFQFDIQKQSGKDVLSVKDITYRYEGEEQPVFSSINLEVYRGERIAIVGENGIGKTTLLKILCDRLKPCEGKVEWGTNVEIGYFDQEQAELTSSKTVLQELWDAFPEVNEQKIRTILGNFLFTNEEVFQSVRSLSGGEKARLALAKLMMGKDNFLILDEPTNHLDTHSKEVLEKALNDFPGTIIFVSHDRYFINKIASQVVEMKQNHLTVYLGDFDYFHQKKKEEEEKKKLIEAKKDQERKEKRKQKIQRDRKYQRDQRKRERQITEIEENIHALEHKINQLEIKMTSKEIYDDYEKSLSYGQKVKALQQKLNELMEEWVQLHEK